MARFGERPGIFVYGRIGVYVRRCLALLCLTSAGCTTFTAVRSADVTPGPRLDAALTVSTPPGDAAAWFWSFDCATNCDHPILSPELGFTYGWRPGQGGRPFEVGAGLSGTYPYLHGYYQFRSGDRPFGLGVRTGLPTGWWENSIFTRHDIRISPETRLLLTSTLFRHSGNSPNGMQPGAFTALVQGVGVEHQQFLTPWLAVVVGKVKRKSYGASISDVAAFLVFGLNITLWRRPTRLDS